MKEDLKNFIKRAKDVRLSEDERGLLRSRIMEFISFNPIRGKTPVINQRNYVSIFEFRHFMKAASLILIVAVVVGGTGVSYAASKALPGEMLYAVKVNINENVEETLATTPKAKIAVQSEHIQKRLDEVQMLRKEKKLSPETQKIVADKITEHTEDVIKSIDTLKKEGDVTTVLETTSTLTPVLEANLTALTDTTPNDNASSTPASAPLVAQVVDDSIKAVQDQENSVIASVKDDAEPTPTDATVMTLSVAAGEEAPSASSTLEKKEAAKAASDIAALSRQLEKLVRDRLDTAKEKIADIKLQEKEDAAEALKNAPDVNDTTTPTPESGTTTPSDALVTSTESTLSLQTSLKVLKTADPLVTPETATPKSEEKQEQATPAKDTFVETRIKTAEAMIRSAQKLFDSGRFKEALMLAQDVNKIASEIEAYKNLKKLELAKQINVSTTEKASVADSVKK
jgi:hypothetical protein